MGYLCPRDWSVQGARIIFNANGRSHEGLQCLTFVPFILRVENKIVKVSLGYSEHSYALVVIYLCLPLFNAV